MQIETCAAEMLQCCKCDSNLNLPYDYNKKMKKSQNKQVRKKTQKRKQNVEVGFIATSPLPHKMWTALKVYTVGGLIDAALAINSKVYRPTSLFDIEPDVGGPSYGGYAFWSAGYGRYRVLSFDYEIRVNNLQSDAVCFGVYPIALGSTPSELGSSANPEVAMENSMGQTKLLGPVSGMSTATLRGHVDCSRVWGTIEAKTAEGWAGITGGSPSANTWLMLTAERINQLALAIGCQYTLTITAHGYWDQRVSLVA
jgi:hypothetical protein